MNHQYQHLRAQIDSALRAGVSVDDIDDRIIATTELDDRQKAAMWLYAFSHQHRRWRSRFVEQQLHLVGLR